MDPQWTTSVPYHALRRDHPYLQAEFRQDEVHDAEGLATWARRFAALSRNFYRCQAKRQEASDAYAAAEPMSGLMLNSRTEASRRSTR